MVSQQTQEQVCFAHAYHNFATIDVKKRSGCIYNY